MTIHYVDSNASGANDGSSWTDAYADISTACADTAVFLNGDTLWLASDHYKDYGASKTLTFPGSHTIISVNSSTDAYVFGAKEEVSTSGEDLTLTTTDIGILEFIGITFTPEDRLALTKVFNKYIFEDCYLDISSITHTSQIETEITNTQINMHNTFGYGQIFLGPNVLFMDNVTFTAVASQVRSLFEVTSNGNATVNIKNSDLSIGDATEALFMSESTSRTFQATLRKCKLYPGRDLYYSVSYNSYVDAISCDTDDGYYRFNYECNNGEATEDTETYLDGTYDGSTGFSLMMNSNANSSITNPLRYKLIEIPAEDLTSSVDVTVQFLQTSEAATPANLKNTDYWLEAVSSDSTDNALGIVTSSGTDVLATGSDHSSGTGTWTKSATYINSQKDTITVPASFSNDIIEIWVCLAKINTDVWNDPAVVIT